MSLPPLQENQSLPNDFDQDTGFVNEDAELKRTVLDLEKVLAQKQAFDEMKSTRGWQIYEQFVKNQIDNLTNLLKVEQDFDKIRRIQSELIAFESLFKIIELNFVEAERAKTELNNLIGPPQDNPIEGV